MSLVTYHSHLHNYFPFTAGLVLFCALIHIGLTWQVLKLRIRHKVSAGEIQEENFRRRNGALHNFSACMPLVVILYFLAENNFVNAGWLFFLGGIFVFARLVHIHSMYTYEVKTGRYTLRTFGVVVTFGVILALAGLNLYEVLTHTTF